MNVVLFSRSYDGVVGGIEKLSLKIAGALVDGGYSVHLVSLDPPNARMFFDLPSGVTWHKINLSKTHGSASWRLRLERIGALRLLLREIKPTTFIAFQVGSFALMRVSAIGLGIAGIAAERNAPTLFKFIRFGKLKYIFYQFILSFAKVIAVQFPEYRKLYVPFVRSRIRVTPNLVTIPSNRNHVKQSNLRIKILYVGRVSYQKNLDILVSALDYDVSSRLDLTVVGDGEMLSSIIENYPRVASSIHFYPFQSDLSGFYLESDLLCLPSRWEGFPNVVAEAMSFGIPVIGFLDCAGVNSLIIPGVNGELVESRNDRFLFEKLINFDATKYDGDAIVRNIAQYDKSLFTQSWIEVVEVAISKV